MRLMVSATPFTSGGYPRNLSDLLEDPRKPTSDRHLRKLHADPITGNSEWGIVKAPDGGVMGVQSLSEDKPLKSANFRARDREFEGKMKCADWKFVFTPALQSAIKPTPTAPAAR